MKLVWAGLRLTIVGLMAVLGLLASVLGYQGLYLEITGRFTDGAARLAVFAGLAIATGLLIRYRGELVDERA
jgi:hypothetical protein